MRLCGSFQSVSLPSDKIVMWVEKGFKQKKNVYDNAVMCTIPHQEIMASKTSRLWLGRQENQGEESHLTV